LLANATSFGLCGLEHRRRSRPAYWGEFQHFLGLARGSLLELDTQLAIAFDLGYLNEDAFSELDGEVYQVLGLLNRLIESIRNKEVSKVADARNAERR
jgi:four helix bundle protein